VGIEDRIYNCFAETQLWLSVNVIFLASFKCSFKYKVTVPIVKLSQCLVVKDTGVELACVSLLFFFFFLALSKKSAGLE